MHVLVHDLKRFFNLQKMMTTLAIPGARDGNFRGSGGGGRQLPQVAIQVAANNPGNSELFAYFLRVILILWYVGKQHELANSIGGYKTFATVEALFNYFLFNADC